MERNSVTCAPMLTVHEVGMASHFIVLCDVDLNYTVLTCSALCESLHCIALQCSVLQCSVLI
jgi:hypothetical protein